MPHQIPVSSVLMSFKDGQFTLSIDGQPFNLRLLQRVELVIDALLTTPFIRLTALTGDTGVTLGNTVLEVQHGDPGRHTFDDSVAWPSDSAGRAGPAPGHQEG